MNSRSIRSLRPLHTGGDRRSIAGSNRALALVLASPGRVRELAVLAKDPDWLVSLRALDVLEKLGPLADSDKWEVQLQIVRALPFLHLPLGAPP